ncbi:MAG: TylF/MycF/NovP-related O-methyltransferase [Pseudomonadota bacterium]
MRGGIDMGDTRRLNSLKSNPLWKAASRVKWSSLHKYHRLRSGLHARGLLPWTPLVPEEAFLDSCRNILDTLDRRAHDFGDYVEFGVSRGTSMASMNTALEDTGHEDVRLIGFDSFAGMPPGSDAEGWEPGWFRSTRGATCRYLKSRGVNLGKTELVEGWFDETLTDDTAESVALEKASVIMIDCDIYSSSKAALWFVAPFIRDEAVLIFDDWGWRSKDDLIGQREAYSEFLEAFPDIREVERYDAYIPEARIILVERAATEF